MFVDVLGKYIGYVLMSLSPLEDGSTEVVFVKMAGKDIDMLILLQERWYDTIQVQPVVEYQDGLFRFQHKAAMENVRQRHQSIM
jgi:hypothetical protein